MRVLKVGEGGHLNSQIVSGTWSQEEKNIHINLLELKAIILTLQYLEEMIKKISVYE